MPFTKDLPEWNAPGTAPPQSKKDEGWLPIEKPPADWWNWFKYTTYQALKELQENTYTKTEAETIAQGKVNTHEKKTDNPHKVTTQQVNTVNSNYKNGTDSGDGYPIGLTLFWTDSNSSGWPTASGMVLSVRLSTYRMMQYYYANQTNEAWTRTWYNGTWTTWEKVESTTGAQAKVNATQVFKLTSDNGQVFNLPTNTNLNAFFTPGFYYVGSTSLLNAPVQIIGTLEVMSFSSTTVIQRYTTMEASKRPQVFIRYASAGTWGEWRELAPVDRAQMHKLTKDDGVAIFFSGDLNSLIDPGRYYLSGVSNGPNGLSTGLCIVDRLVSNNGYFQEITIANGQKFIRYYNLGSWGPWIEYLTDRAPTFTNLILQNGATAVPDRTPRYTKVGKLVTIEGEINNVAAGTTIATLPAGFRPSSVRNFKTAITGSANDGANIYVNTTGLVNVSHVGSSAGAISLMGISFYVD